MDDGDHGPMAPPASSDRRAAWLAAAVLVVAVVGGVIVLAVAAPEPGPRRDRGVTLQEPGDPQPHIIPRPGEGHVPTQPGDRGGWEQLATLAAIVLALAVIVGLVWRSSRRARRRRPQPVA